MSAPASSSAETEQGSSPWRDAWLRLRRNRLAVTGGVMLLVLSLACIVGPWLSPYDYAEQDLDNTFAPPGAAHWLGTDQLGRDLLVRVLYGGRISLGVGLCATIVALTIGVIYGAVAGWVGGRTDAVMMRIVDIIYALPFTIFVILLMVFFGRNIVLLFVAIGAVEWLTMARIVRGQIMSLKKMEFIEAARSLGFGNRRIIFRHLLPNALAPVFVAATFTVGDFIIWESILAYFIQGIVDPPVPSWGNMVVGGIQHVGRLTNLNPFADIRAFLFLLPTLMIFISVLCINYIGDTLREILDPRQSVQVR
jgi:oligopeptide transport system permease protein